MTWTQPYQEHQCLIIRKSKASQIKSRGKANSAPIQGKMVTIFSENTNHSFLSEVQLQPEISLHRDLPTEISCLRSSFVSVGHTHLLNHFTVGDPPRHPVLCNSNNGAEFLSSLLLQHCSWFSHSEAFYASIFHFSPQSEPSTNCTGHSWNEIFFLLKLYLTVSL